MAESTTYIEEFMLSMLQSLKDSFAASQTNPDGWSDIDVVRGTWDVSDSCEGVSVALGVEVLEADPRIQKMDGRDLCTVVVTVYMRRSNEGDAPYIKLLGDASKVAQWARYNYFAHVVDAQGLPSIGEGVRIVPVVADGPFGVSDYTQCLCVVTFPVTVVLGAYTDAGWSVYPGDRVETVEIALEAYAVGLDGTPLPAPALPAPALRVVSGGDYRVLLTIGAPPLPDTPPIPGVSGADSYEYQCRDAAYDSQFGAFTVAVAAPPLTDHASPGAPGVYVYDAVRRGVENLMVSDCYYRRRRSGIELPENVPDLAPGVYPLQAGSYWFRARAWVAGRYTPWSEEVNISLAPQSPQ